MPSVYSVIVKRDCASTVSHNSKATVGSVCVTSKYI